MLRHRQTVAKTQQVRPGWFWAHTERLPLRMHLARPCLYASHTRLARQE